MKKWKTISSESALNSKWFKVKKEKVEIHNGKIIDDYYIWQEPRVVWIVPVTKGGNIILVKQYKHGIGEIVIEYPGAVVEDGESYEDCAKRELQEETGFTSNKFELLGEFVSNPTKSEGRIQIFLAKDCIKVSDQYLDENESIDIIETNFQNIEKMIKTGEIKFVGSIAATYLVKDLINK